MANTTDSPAQELRQAILDGKPVRRGNGEPAEQGHSWGDERSLPASELYELLAGPENGTRPRAAILEGLRITGRLNLQATELKAPLVCHGCYFDEPVNLMIATAVAIGLTACHLPGLAADQLTTRGDLELSKSSLGVAGLSDAHIGGRLLLSGATFDSGSYLLDLGAGSLNPRESLRYTFTGVSLVADGLKVDADMFCGEGFDAQGEVRLPGAHIAGALTFSDATLGQDLAANNLTVGGNMFCGEDFNAQGEVRLRGAHIAGALTFSNATLGQSLTADGLTVDGNMFCGEDFNAQGEVCLRGAHIAGALTFNNATLGQDLTADNLTVGGNMFCEDRFSARGEVRLRGAHIAGQLGFNNATLGEGLAAYWLTVDEGMFCEDGFHSQGVIWLSGAHITGHLGFKKAVLGRGLTADRLRVDGDMCCGESFNAQGQVSLRGAHITGHLTFDTEDTKAEEVGALSLRLDGACIDHALGLYFAVDLVDEINLTNARVGRLTDSESAWPQRLRLGGLVYASVSAIEDDATSYELGEGWLERQQSRLGHAAPDVARRLKWIRHAEDSSGGESSARAGYLPQPYTQLMDFYRREGRDGDARCVAYERERRRWQQLGKAGKVWNGFLRWTVGYGYRPLRALGLLVALLGVGTIAFSHFHRAHEIVPIKAAHPPFDAIIYTLDRLVPVVSFGLREAYAPTGAAQWWAASYAVLGWVLGIAVIAGLSSAMRRDN